MIDRTGRRPRFLAKASLWRNPFIRMILAGAKQIPVERGSGGGGPIEEAEAALARGEIVVIYPESTITNTDDVTPMRATKTGVARLALATGVPVYPVGVWGAQWLFGKYRKSSYRFRRTIMVTVGDPMAFDGLRDSVADPDVRRDVTDRVMKEVDRLVRELHAIHPEGAAVPERKQLKEAAS
jgi:1-acyl-sn-glycerol-3-phosphate acyltransferase